MGALCNNIALAINLMFLLIRWMNCWPEDPTHGFTELPLNTSNYQIQKPYNLPLGNRYSFVNGVHKLWVYSTDKPLSKSSPTKPRTEISITVKHFPLSNILRFLFSCFSFFPSPLVCFCLFHFLFVSKRKEGMCVCEYIVQFNFYPLQDLNAGDQ